MTNREHDHETDSDPDLSMLQIWLRGSAMDDERVELVELLIDAADSQVLS